MIKCENCGRTLDDNSQYCDACGTKCREDAARTVDPFQTPNYNNTSYSNTSQTDNLFQTNDYNNIVGRMSNSEEYRNKSTGGALACGILAIVFCLLNLFLPFVHLIGIALGSVAVSLSAKYIKLKVPLAIGAFVTGLIGVILGVVFIIIGAIGVALIA